MSPHVLTHLTLGAKRSPHIQLAKQKGCLDANHCVTLRVFGKDFYPSVFGNGNFATCENLMAATAAGVHRYLHEPGNSTVCGRHGENGL